MEKEIKLRRLVKLKYNDSVAYEEKLLEWGLREEEVLSYEEDTDFEYYKDFDKKRQGEHNMTEKPIDKDEEEFHKKNLKWARDFKARTAKKKERRVLLIDGDNNIDGLTGLKEEKNKFDAIYCWTVTQGNQATLESKYGIKVKRVKQIPQAVDNIMHEKLNDQDFIGKYDKIYIISHDKGFDKYKGKKSFFVNKTIKEVRYDIEHENEN